MFLGCSKNKYCIGGRFFERFKKGIVRREGRVLELKGEVNQLLRQAGEPARYRVDSRTDDSRFVQQTLKTKKAVEHE